MAQNPLLTKLEVGGRGLLPNQPDVQRVFVEGIASRLREDSRVIASGKVTIPFGFGTPTAVAGTQISPAPSPVGVSLQVCPLGVFDLLPSAGEPQHFTTLNFPDGGQQRTFMELASKAYSGHVRLMLSVEMFTAGNARFPQPGSIAQAGAKSVLARGMQIVPLLGSYSNTMDPTVGEPNASAAFPDSINPIKTCLPEVTNYLLSNGSYEVDLAQFSPGGRYASVGLAAWLTFNAGIANYPTGINVYYYAVDEPAVGEAKSYPQAIVTGGAALAVNAGGLAAQGYTDSTVLWASGGNASQVTSVAIYNGTTQTLDVDCRMYLGAANEPMLNLTPAVPAQGPANIASGAHALYVIEQSTGGGSTVNPSAVVAYACPLAGATGFVSVTISGE